MMEETNTELNRTLASLLAEARPPSGDHPEPDELLAYLEGSLEPDAERRIRDHLEGCRDCLETVLDLETLAEPEPPRADGAVDFELAGAWRTFKDRTAASEGPHATVEERPSWRRFRLLEAAAAVFFVSTLALSFWVARLQGTLEGRDDPRINVPAVYLDATRAEGPATGRLELPPEADAFLLFLMPTTDPGDYVDYEVEILGSEEERPIWSHAGLEINDAGSLRMIVPRSFLPEGQYQVRLHGMSSGQRELINDYRLEIRWEAP